MIFGLIDNGSLEPAAHLNLRAVAAALSERTGETVHAVSWKHSDRIPAHSLALAATARLASADTNDTSASESMARPSPVAASASEWAARSFPVAASASEWAAGGRAWTLVPFIRSHFARGQREFLFIPFFISAQGAIGSALRNDLEKLQRTLALGNNGEAFEFGFTDGLAARGAIPAIVCDRIRATLAAGASTFGSPPPVIVVDHGGPSAASAALRDQLAAEIQRKLGREIGPLAAASMEGSFGPLLADQLRAPGFAQRDVIVAPLFLAPGRHAGPGGDIARICSGSGARCHVTDLVGTHPHVVDSLSDALRQSHSHFHAPLFA